MSAANNHPHHHDPERCRQYLESISEYVEGDLSPELCQELEAHMESCENCRIVVNTLEKTVMLYRQLPAPDLPNTIKERLYAVLDLEPYYGSPQEEAHGEHGPQDATGTA